MTRHDLDEQLRQHHPRMSFWQLRNAEGPAIRGWQRLTMFLSGLARAFFSAHAHSRRQSRRRMCSNREVGFHRLVGAGKPQRAGEFWL